MGFISVSNASNSTAASAFSFGTPATLTGSLDDIAFGFGMKFSGSAMTSTTTTTTFTTCSTTGTTSSFVFDLNPRTSTGINNTVPVGITSMPCTSTVKAIVTPTMKCGQLEDLLNKWTCELEDQEKYFLCQSNHFNAWDLTVIENGEKITDLQEVEKMKQDQERLEGELDFILSQQKELEDLLTPLKEFVKNDHGGFVYLQQANDHERMYNLAENIGGQLKQVTLDLKDITEYPNAFQSPANTDLLHQICRILNAHLSSLQWINQNSGMLQRKVEEVAEVFED
ncbi:nucleoporin-62 C-terminal-like protein isoform X1 [Manis pentadactyla]|uniref:nucleoporin-62 C-terminal-like protein isoform X1 n=2 Tax=Manis pentadactyla TaxID=143292 RepID=UPI00255C3D94|nr:nucleoporin-62 C-terminal-like protein isoform X1 [Manis pentadactyla]